MSGLAMRWRNIGWTERMHFYSQKNGNGLVIIYQKMRLKCNNNSRTWTIQPFKLDSDGFLIYSTLIVATILLCMATVQCRRAHLFKDPFVASVCVCVCMFGKNNKHLPYINNENKTEQNRKRRKKKLKITMTVASLQTMGGKRRCTSESTTEEFYNVKTTTIKLMSKQPDMIVRLKMKAALD